MKTIFIAVLLILGAATYVLAEEENKELIIIRCVEKPITKESFNSIFILNDKEKWIKNQGKEKLGKISLSYNPFWIKTTDEIYIPTIDSNNRLVKVKWAFDRYSGYFEEIIYPSTSEGKEPSIISRGACKKIGPIPLF